MSRRDVPDSDPDDDGSASSSGEEEEEAEETTVAATAKTVSEYEKQRLSRIAENNAKLEALGLHKMLKEEELDDHDDDDDEYIPDDDAEEPVSDSSDDKDEEFVIGNASGSRKRKVKDKGLKMKAKVSGKKHCNRNSEYVDGDDEDEALRQVILIWFSVFDKHSSFKHVVKNITKSEKKRNIQNQEDKERKKNKKSFASRLQMTEDELIVHFFQLDEAGKGTVSMRDLQRAAIAHDFSWTDKELVDMIRCFDSDGDGRITLDDFRKIAVRCNLIRES
ncbi:nucleolin [Arachis ipaensis]|uniref:nucleolin n=1 Tax=Arachis ipaensis TaxID=130454 RepID=UPI0007AF7284|nr:nucleolin [Arachis ipaensis]